MPSGREQLKGAALGEPAVRRLRVVEVAQRVEREIGIEVGAQPTVQSIDDVGCELHLDGLVGVPGHLVQHGAEALDRDVELGDPTRLHHLPPVVRGFGIGHRPTLPGDCPAAHSSSYGTELPIQCTGLPDKETLVFRSLRSWVGPLAITALIGGASIALSTGPAGGASKANRCVSINGVAVVQSGTAVCISTPPTGTQPNVARATGENSIAEAAVGAGNSATANGPGSIAVAAVGDSNTATANGNGSRSGAGPGNNNAATANGRGSLAQTGSGTGNTVKAHGPCTIIVVGSDNVTRTCHP